jgi:hypothetical protein
MARYINRIPEDYKFGIKVIIALKDSDLAKIIQILNGTPVVLNVRKFNQKIFSQIDFIEPQEAKNLIDTIGSLYDLRLSLNISNEEFADEIVEVIQESSDKSLKLDEGNVENFKQRLSSLLDIESLSLRAKATNLIVDHQTIFRDAKLISDIRPIFGNDVEEKPIATVLIHTLKIEYVENNDLRDFHVALDDKDVTNLIALLKHTQLKAENLKGFVKSVGLLNYEVE